MNDHTVYVRPANWIGMEEDEEEMLREQERSKKVEEFVSFDYNDDKYHSQEGDDDVSVMTGASDMDDAISTAVPRVELKGKKRKN